MVHRCLHVHVCSRLSADHANQKKFVCITRVAGVHDDSLRTPPNNYGNNLWLVPHRWRHMHGVSEAGCTRVAYISSRLAVTGDHLRLSQPGHDPGLCRQLLSLRQRGGEVVASVMVDCLCRCPASVCRRSVMRWAQMIVIDWSMKISCLYNSCMCTCRRCTRDSMVSIV